MFQLIQAAFLNLPAHNSTRMPELLTQPWWALQLSSGPLSSPFKQFVCCFWLVCLKVEWDWLPLPVLHLYFTHGRICFSVWILFHSPFSSQISPPSKIPFFSTCVVINFSFLLHLPFIPPSIHLSVCHKQTSCQNMGSPSPISPF